MPYLIIFVTSFAAALGLSIALDRTYDFSVGLRVVLLLFAVLNMAITVLAFIRL